LVRAEELINYFKYNYPQPEPGEQIAMTYEIGECPWQSKHKLVKIALKAKEIQRENLPASHLVFLIDCSGSMGVNNRIDMVKNSLKMLANQLKSTDKISIIAFSNNVQILLNNESGSNIENIKNTIDQLYSRGGTNGERAIETAYAIAKDNFIPGGNNRVVLCTDGDFNIGVNTEKELENLISEKSRMNVFLSVYGFGMGNFKDNKVKTLSLKGHGNYAYIDSLLEANQAIIKDYSGAMFAVAKDVKIQVEFNPAKVSAYRLIGYETGKLNSTDFNNDQKEAGVMGVGQQVTALYEIMPDNVYMVDPLKYQQVDVMEPKTYSDEFMTVKVRYKMPEEDLSKKIELAVIDNNSGEVSSDFRFASAVAMFGQILSESNHKGNSSFTKVIELANEALDYDESGNRHEFVKMVEIAMCL
jgi:Ca-activated chloride channel family protein